MTKFEYHKGMLENLERLASNKKMRRIKRRILQAAEYHKKCLFTMSNEQAMETI